MLWRSWKVSSIAQRMTLGHPEWHFVMATQADMLETWLKQELLAVRSSSVS